MYFNPFEIDKNDYPPFIKSIRYEKTFYCDFIIFLISTIGKTQDMDQISKKLFIGMTMNEVSRFMNLHVSKNNLFPDYNKRFYSVKARNELKFVAYFDENWKCFMTISKYPDGHESILTDLAINKGYKYKEKNVSYINKDSIIVMNNYQLNDETYWKTVKIDFW
ncbi:MAG: hypothetical protein ACI9GZ_002782 [Bacteroidia bacterium]